jgi:hypothetical protein
MSETNPDPDQLETLQQMLEAEMRVHAEPGAAPAKPAMVEAKADDLGSLLGDLLSEAQKEVVRERPDLSGTLSESGQENRPASAPVQTPDSDEAAAHRLSQTAPDALTITLQDTKPGIQGPISSQASNRKTVMVAAAAVIVAAAIFGFLTQPKPEMALPDIGERVGDTLSRANLKWQTQEAKRQVQEAKLLVEEAKKSEAAAKLLAAEAIKAAAVVQAAELAHAQDEAQKEAAPGEIQEQEAGGAPPKATAKSRSRKSKKASGESSKSSSSRKSSKRRRGKKLRIKTNVF